MTHSYPPEVNYRQIFEAGPAPYLILLPDEFFTILEVNQAYLNATMRTRDELIGQRMFDAFPDNPQAPGSSGVSNLRASLQRAVATGEPDSMALQRYDIPRPEQQGGGFEERYWSPVNTPVLSPEGKVLYLIHRVEDVTQLVYLKRDRERDQDAKATLKARNDEMLAELVASSEKLKAANERLRVDAERKNEFLAMLAHELRTPLAAAANVSHLLQPMAAEDAQTADHLQVLNRQITSLKHLVDSLLDVSRITRGMVQIKREVLDFAVVVNHAVATVRPLLEERHHNINVVLPDDPVVVVGDELRLEQILINLLTNAVRYTQPGGRIEVSLRAKGSQAALRVRDNGIGIAPDMLDQIFDMFAQVEQDLARSAGGLGVGLTVVKQLVELHQGSITAYSPGLNQGAEFVVQLPLAQQSIAESENLISEHETSGAESIVGARAKPQRILIVEDNRDIADTMTLLLQAWGHAVSIAYDGPAGLEQATAFAPDLVLLDIGLPDMDGYEVARRMRLVPQLEDTVLAALTGYGDHNDRQRVFASGFDAHFIKPVDLGELERFIAQLS